MNSTASLNFSVERPGKCTKISQNTGLKNFRHLVFAIKLSGIADMTIVSVLETDQAFLFGGYDGQDLQSDVYEMMEDSINKNFRFQYITRLLKVR